MAHPFKLLERTQGTQATILPFQTTPDDIRGIVQFLKKKPEGITVGDMLDGIFDPRKIAAYESLELIVRNGKQLKLSSLGWELARKLEPETHIFRFILKGIEPYNSILKRAHQQHLHTLIPEGVTDHWLELYPRFFDSGDYETTEGMAVCFLHLCQAAALGHLFIGQDRMPTCFYLDAEELTEYITDEPLSFLTQIPAVVSVENETKQNAVSKDLSSSEPVKPSVKVGTSLQTVALKVLSQALVKVIEELNVPQDASNIGTISFSDEVQRFEAEIIRSALLITGGRQRRAAHLLNMSKTALNAKIKRYKITYE